MATDKKKKASLTVKELPQELLDRVNAKAALLQLDQPSFVIGCLDRATKELKPVREEIKSKWDREAS